MVETLKDAAWASLFVFGAFAGLGGLATPALKGVAAAQIKSAGSSAAGERWSDQAAGLLDGFFGPKHLSWRCFSRSAIVSLLTVFVADQWSGTVHNWMEAMSIAAGTLGIRTPENYYAPLGMYLAATLAGLVFNVVPDYLSIAESRWIIRKIQADSSVIFVICWLLIDLVFTGGIFATWVGGYPVIVNGDPWHIIELLEDSDALWFIYGAFFLSTFVTSVWVWLYAISLPLARVLRSLLSLLGIVRRRDRDGRLFFDIDGKPFQVLGGVAAVLVFILWVAIGIGWKAWNSHASPTTTTFGEQHPEWIVMLEVGTPR